MYDLKSVDDNIGYNVSLEAIYEKVDDYKLFAYYVGHDFKLRESFNSPIREDKNPSWSVFKARNGHLMYKDFATGDSGDIVKLVSKLHSCSFKEALHIIDRDFELKLGPGSHLPKMNGYVSNIDSSTVEELPRNSNIGIKIQRFRDQDVTFWKQFGINIETLKKYNVFSVSILFMNGFNVSSYSKNNPIYAYVFQKDNKITYKIYKPFDPKYKWSSNVDKSVLQGWDQLPPKGEELIITKSLKDVMVLDTMGYASVAMQSEMSTIKPSVMEELNRRFKKIYLLQDFDYAGVSGANRLRKEYPFIMPFFIQSFKTRSNGLKDISDYVKHHGWEPGYQMIYTIINNL